MSNNRCYIIITLRNTNSSQHELLLNIIQSLEWGLGAYYHYIEAKKPFPQQKYFLFYTAQVLDIIVNLKNLLHNLNLEKYKHIIFLLVLSLSFYFIKFQKEIDFNENYTNTISPDTKNVILVFVIQMLNQLSSIITEKNNKDKIKYIILLINAILYLSGKYKLIGSKSFNHNAIWHTGIIIANLIN